MKNSRVFSPVVLTVALLASTGFVDAQTAVPSPDCSSGETLLPPVPEGFAGVADASVRFGYKLLREAARVKARENVFLSPISAAQALEMLYQGAGGETQKAMSKALLLENISLETLNKANSYALSLLEGDKCVQFSSANSLWAKPGFSILETFSNTARAAYGAEVKSADLGTLEGIGQVNAWVSDKTRGKIDKLLDAPVPDTDLLLLNATYFKGLWSKPFKKEDTLSKPFYLQDGSSKTVPMMSQKLEKVDYVDTSTFEGVRLSYKSSAGRAFVTELYLPKKTSSLSNLVIRASSGGLNRLNWEKGSGTLELPRFKLETKTDLEPLLTKLGMGVAFTDAASFGKLSPQPTRVSGAFQKAVLEVNEEGAVAAAATGVLMQTTSIALPPRLFNLVLNRPFFITIREQNTNVPLFLGAVYNPSSL